MDDSTGALRLRAWVEDVRRLPKDAPQRTIVQRLVYPGVSPVEGRGLLTAHAHHPVHHPGEGAQWSSLVHFMQAGDGSETNGDPEANERDAMLGSLLTLAADRRCQLIPELSARVQGAANAFMIPMNLRTDDTLTAPMPSWSAVDKQLADAVARLVTMPEKDASAIMAAIHMHYSSALLFTRDITGAYALAVGGVETLAARYGKTSTNWEDWDRAGSWEKFFKKNSLSEEQAQALRDRLLSENHIRLTERFVSYVCENLPGNFWAEKVRAYVWGIDSSSGEPIQGDWHDNGPRSQQFAEEPTALRAAVRASYQRRSRFVHAGERSAGFVEELFGIGPGNVRDSLSYAQLRAGLRRLILTELSKRGDPKFPDRKKFVVDVQGASQPHARGASFFRERAS